MKIITKENSIKGTNLDNCKVDEYSFGDNDIDVGVVHLTGRYPKEGYCLNEVCKEVIYVLEGNGKIVFEDEEIYFKKDDAILIEPNTKYYWDVKECTATMTCTPAFSPKQYKLIK